MPPTYEDDDRDFYPGWLPEDAEPDAPEVPFGDDDVGDADDQYGDNGGVPELDAEDADQDDEED